MKRIVSIVLSFAVFLSLAVVFTGRSFAAGAKSVTGTLCDGVLTVTVYGIEKASNPYVTLWIKNLSADSPDIDAVSGKTITLMPQTIETGKNNNTVTLQKRKGLSYQVTAVLKNADGSDGAMLNPVTINKLGVTYQAHVQKTGWQNPVADGDEAGTEGKSLRVEALKINLTGTLPANASIVYKAHVQKIGWQNAVSDGAICGTSGKGLRVEALRVTLKNMPGYAVQYRAYVQKAGWMNWQSTTSGTSVDKAAIAGTSGKNLRIEALEIRIVKL